MCVLFGSISAAAPWEGLCLTHPTLNTSSASGSGCSHGDRFGKHFKKYRNKGGPCEGICSPRLIVTQRNNFYYCFGLCCHFVPKGNASMQTNPCRRNAEKLFLKACARVNTSRKCLVTTVQSVAFDE